MSRDPRADLDPFLVPSKQVWQLPLFGPEPFTPAQGASAPHNSEDCESVIADIGYFRPEKQKPALSPVDTTLDSIIDDIRCRRRIPTNGKSLVVTRLERLSPVFTTMFSLKKEAQRLQALGDSLASANITTLINQLEQACCIWLEQSETLTAEDSETSRQLAFVTSCQQALNEVNVTTLTKHHRGLGYLLQALEALIAKLATSVGFLPKPSAERQDTGVGAQTQQAASSTKQLRKFGVFGFAPPTTAEAGLQKLHDTMTTLTPTISVGG